MIGNLVFATPLLLTALIALPVLWWLLRAVPPAPIRRRFPGVALLLGLDDPESQSDKTPWWLLLLRMLAIAAAIVGFAGPVLNPDQSPAGRGPLLVLVDGDWASARDWPVRLTRAEAVLAEASRAGRAAALVQLTDLPEGDLPLQSADAWMQRLEGLSPAPYAPDREAVIAWAEGLEGPLDTYWLAGGLDWPGRAAVTDALLALGDVTVFPGTGAIRAAAPAVYEGGDVAVPLRRAEAGPAREETVAAWGPDPAGTMRALLREAATFAEGATTAEARFDLPPELRNRITRFEIEGARHAGAVTLTGDSLRRREVALISGAPDREGQDLLSQVHYLREALEPSADILEGTLADLLLTSPDVVILADVAQLSPAEADDLQAWVEDGGLLVRFAGPRLAASDVARDRIDPLMPVRLREGGRTVGGTMSWGEPQALRPFDETSPFFGLDVPDDVTVESQVMAQPDPFLADRTIAALADGTPLVTRSDLGQGQVVLFHVTANAEWSSLPLSGLFVQMLERLAISSRAVDPGADDLEGITWEPVQVLDGFGIVRDAGVLPGVSGADLAGAPLSVEMPPGRYEGGEQAVARNVIADEAPPLRAANWPESVAIDGLGGSEETDLMAAFLMAALVGLLADLLASLALSGKLRGTAQGVVTVLALALLVAAPAEAQEADAGERLGLRATSEVTLAYVRTGDAEVDEVSHAGLRGLGNTLFQRTSVEPAAPIGVDLEQDELAFFPMLYWPVMADQALPSEAAYARLNAYLRGGGMIVFDTRDADIGRFGSGTPAGRRLQQLAAPLDIPPLEPIPEDHVLTRTFYLLQDFPGRHTSRDIWVEAAPPDAEAVEGMPFRDLNDGVTPVLIGGNDWAAAWAQDARGDAMFPVGRGFTGERQREIALRFGVNLVMHVLSGNYKSDQVHVPALLDRLGN